MHTHIVSRYDAVPFRLGVPLKFLFDDESFSFEALRAAGFANYGGADLGEVIVTAGAIPEGDEGAWHREWKATAQRVEALGRDRVELVDVQPGQVICRQGEIADSFYLIRMGFVKVSQVFPGGELVLT